ncbi:WGxxGxxG family protein [Paenibacillus kobensis]|uniref:WGxxGxxG family protein n=1 Tax=Paenibacillus kobensis TaxID=59841 RepID=UPI000FDB420A|nr:WGxxGxxG family protein [Paenibacillus kobensis]
MRKAISMFAVASCLTMMLAAGHSEAASTSTTVGSGLQSSAYNGTNEGYNTNNYNNTVGNGMNATSYNNEGNYRTRALANDDNDFDWGWLGLLGLIGLAGMRSRSRERERT